MTAMHHVLDPGSCAGHLPGPRARAPLVPPRCSPLHKAAFHLQRSLALSREAGRGKRCNRSRRQVAAQDFPAATVDYDADSDSMDEFSSGDEAPASFSGYDSEDQGVEAVTQEGEADEKESELDEEEEPPIASTSGEGPFIEVAGMPSWGNAALDAAQSVLGMPELQGLQLYSFRAAAKRDRLYIRLDKLEDQYGSPTLDEVSIFSRNFYSALEAKVGEKAAGELSVEVSSPGAERIVRVPSELQRFQALPMLVTHEGEAEKGSQVLQLLELNTEAGTSVWGLANVRANRDKKQKLTKKQEAQRFEIPLSTIKQARLHLDA
ncbi:hypothetical protein CVIRNUC_009663 [Coccomyxa viridis]|uniref:DUF7912 domain-containing protein n=1 Tax=Coccomyxa viridis TaxID=1274662 RepID=A0AAV1IJR5_9CHLO|nr:hypothetical protein CVIRNUC_009663 [Coccomyxa viridis]